MTEHKTEQLRYLTERVGVPEEIARLRLCDEDLWIFATCRGAGG